MAKDAAPLTANALRPDVQRLVEAVQELVNEDFSMIGEVTQATDALVEPTNRLAEQVDVAPVTIPDD